MSRPQHFQIRGGPVILLAALLFVTASRAGHHDESIDVIYAERQPLSTRSLLLDIATLPGGGYVAVGERGHVVRSADGERWQQAEVVPTRSTLTSVTRGGGRLWAAGHDTVIITSGDDGKTWTQQYFDPERQQAIMDIHFFDQKNGMAIGAYGLALVTSDGGRNWQEFMVNEEEWHNNALLKLDGGRLMVAGEAGFTYRSDDDGLTWETIEMPYPGSMFGIVAGSGNCVVVFGLRGNVQESCDFGDTWRELDTGTEASVAGATRWQDMNVFVGNSGLVMTRRGRGPFEVAYHSSGVDFAAVVAAGEGRFLLVGEDGIHRYPETQVDD